MLYNTAHCYTHGEDDPLSYTSNNDLTWTGYQLALSTCSDHDKECFTILSPTDFVAWAYWMSWDMSSSWSPSLTFCSHCSSTAWAYRRQQWWKWFGIGRVKCWTNTWVVCLFVCLCACLFVCVHVCLLARERGVSLHGSLSWDHWTVPTSLETCPSKVSE